MASRKLEPVPGGVPKSVADLAKAKLILGAGVFNYQYTDTPHDLDADIVLRRAFELGIRAFDTSAYYGPSEQIVGDALRRLRSEYPRESYYVCTKAGRVAEHHWDYAPAALRASVERSIDRLDAGYIDLLYLHDVEFVDTESCLTALDELFRLKAEGLVRAVGISGYPLDFLLHLATRYYATRQRPLDAVLSYSNMCIQNTRLASYSPRFRSDAKVTAVINASPLSMSLLRSQHTHAFHPAPDNLRKAVARAAQFTAGHSTELADLAVRFAIREWNGPLVIGLQTLAEVETAVSDYWKAQDASVDAFDAPIVNKVREILGDTLDLTWPSGIDHPDMAN